MPDLLWTHPRGKAVGQLLLAHGAGAPMDSAFMEQLALALAASGVAVARFEFDYMAARRCGGAKRPPERADKLLAQFEAALALMPAGAVWVGGKSMGGRMATLLAAAAAPRLAGVLCYGYPFHPVGKPEVLRTEHLGTLPVPLLICQGERDPFGTREQVADYELPESVELRWLPDGDHDLKPRKASGHTHEGNISAAAQASATWMAASVR